MQPVTSHSASVNSSSMKSQEKRVATFPHKRTDLRYELWVKERRAIRERAKKNCFRVAPSEQKMKKGTVTVDTTKARSNVDVVRLCLQELGWREVSLCVYVFF